MAMKKSIVMAFSMAILVGSIGLYPTTLHGDLMCGTFSTTYQDWGPWNPFPGQQCGIGSCQVGPCPTLPEGERTYNCDGTITEWGTFIESNSCMFVITNEYCGDCVPDWQ